VKIERFILKVMVSMLLLSSLFRNSILPFLGLFLVGGTKINQGNMNEQEYKHSGELGFLTLAYDRPVFLVGVRQALFKTMMVPGGKQ